MQLKITGSWLIVGYFYLLYKQLHENRKHVEREKSRISHCRR